MMKIATEHYEVMKQKCLEAGMTPARIRAHRGVLESDSRVVDLGKRLRWDVLYAAVGSAWICNNLYPYVNDTHIDTAARRLLAELENA